MFGVPELQLALGLSLSYISGCHGQWVKQQNTAANRLRDLQAAQLAQDP
jgi:hypothetical protein